MTNRDWERYDRLIEDYNDAIEGKHRQCYEDDTPCEELNALLLAIKELVNPGSVNDKGRLI